MKVHGTTVKITLIMCVYSTLLGYKSQVVSHIGYCQSMRVRVEGEVMHLPLSWKSTDKEK